MCYSFRAREFFKKLLEVFIVNSSESSLGVNAKLVQRIILIRVMIDAYIFGLHRSSLFINVDGLIYVK